MAPSFFAKLTRAGNSSNASSNESSPRQSHSRSPSDVQKKSAPAQIRITPAFDLSPTTDAVPDEIPSDGGSSLNVNVIPPSPSISAHSAFKTDESSPNLRPRTTSFSTASRPAQPPTPAEDGELTPMPHRSDNPLRHAKSTGSLKVDTQPGALGNPPNHKNTSPHNRYATLATPQPSNILSKRASNSSLTVDTSKEKRVTSSRSEPLVESPTSPVPPVPAITKSFTTNNIPSNSFAFLSPTKQKDSDAASIRSVSSSRSRSFFSGGTFDSIKKSRSKSPKRKPTGLASAIAISGLTVAMSPQNEIAEQLKDSVAAVEKGYTRNRTISSASKHDKQTSSLELPGNSSGTRSRAPSFAQPSEYSSGSEETDEEESDDVDDVTADLMPVTGFAVASSKRNADFHELFPDIPEGDYLIEDYGCALQKDILVQGRLYISENHVCFHANIFGWITDLTIPMHEIITLEKKMTAFVIPNAILITTRNNKYTLASFLSRDNTYEVIHNSWRMSGADISGNGGGSMRTSFDSAESGRTGMEGTRVNGIGGIKSDGGKGIPAKAPKVTKCQCGKDGSHYSEVAMEAVFPGTPEKIHNLIFASGFIKDFMREEQKLIDLQISDWAPSANCRGNPGLLTRNMSYIKPLNGSIGPRQTKCELSDEVVHCDFDDFVSTLTTTRTPDVPSGNVFSVKTRTCIMWASNVSCRVIVTTQVEWSGRSFIKGIIEKNCIDGQKTYHIDLDKAIRGYIQNHLSEFVPEGVTEAEVVVTRAVAAAIPDQMSPPIATSEDKALSYNRRGLQWAYDTFEGAFDVAKKSVETAFELIGDALDSYSSVPWSYVIIFLLVITNVWTLWRSPGKADAKRKKEMLRNEEREKWVKEAVTTLWQELSKNGGISPYPAHQPPPESARPEGGDGKPGSWRGEVEDISRVLDELQARLDGLRAALKEAQTQTQHQDEPQGSLGDLD